MQWIAYHGLYGYAECLEFLVKNGANANHKDKVNKCAKLQSGTTALHLAAAGGQFGIIRFLIRKNVDINHQNRVIINSNFRVVKQPYTWLFVMAVLIA